VLLGTHFRSWQLRSDLNTPRIQMSQQQCWGTDEVNA
jgi:hypothetical protein